MKILHLHPVWLAKIIDMQKLFTPQILLVVIFQYICLLLQIRTISTKNVFNCSNIRSVVNI